MQVHRQRALLHRASMSAYADTLRERGFNVQQRLHHQARDTEEHLQALLKQGFRSFHLADPIDDLLSKRLQSFVASHSCALEVSATPMLLTPDAVVEEHFNNGRRPFMAKFYEMQRRRLGVLMVPTAIPLEGDGALMRTIARNCPRASWCRRSRTLVLIHALIWPVNNWKLSSCH